MAEPLPLHYGRILLRRLCADDLRAFKQYRHDEAVGRYQGWRAQSDAEALAFLNDMANAPFLAPGEWLQLGIVEPGNENPHGNLIGDVGLHVHDDGTDADIGFSLSTAAQGRGLATEAVRASIDLLFTYSRISRVLGVTDERNVSSVRLLERSGTQKIATQWATFRGSPCMEHTYALIRSDWPGDGMANR